MKPAPKEGGKPYRKTVAKLLNELKPNAVLDIACGSGWVKSALNYSATMHGMDFYAVAPDGYDVFRKTDMNTGVPDEFGQFDAAVCCEAMLYLQNPGLFLTSVRRHLRNGGVFIITCPNPTYAGTRLNQLIQGFPRSYSHFVQNATPEAHMPWLSLGLFQFWLLLGLNGFKDIAVHDVEEDKPKHTWERPFGFIAKIYCRSRLKKSKSEIKRRLWSQAQSDQVIYGRRLVISAVAA